MKTCFLKNFVFSFFVSRKERKDFYYNLFSLRPLRALRETFCIFHKIFLFLAKNAKIFIIIFFLCALCALCEKLFFPN
jgi:hypothetical protein